MSLFSRAGRRIAGVVLAIGVLVLATAAQADPPIRAARIGYLQGPVSFAPAGNDTWVEANLNRPVTIGDSLWTDADARAELQLGVADVRLDEYTSVQLLNLDDRTIQLQVTQGRINVHARTLRNGEVLEIDTPNVAFTIRQAGDYRIDVDPSEDATTISVRQGAGEVYGEGAALTLRGGDAVRFYGRDLRVREFYSLAPIDEFDRWSFQRDRRAERALSARYVSPEVIGYADLDQYGAWREAEGYGNVWFPREVPREWAPYRYGHWSWIDPWGWSWVDDAPWGFAPFHYGRWAQFNDRWGWVPGPRNVRPIYAPALVAFVGGSNFNLSFSSGPGRGSGIGWFPLGPGEVYRPAYNSSRDYFRNVNVSNTVVNTNIVNNYYNNTTNETQVNYRNARMPNAVTAVPSTVFAQSQPVQRGMVSVNSDLLQRAQLSAVPAIAPTRMGMVGGQPTTNRRPSEQIVNREVVARAAPPAPLAPAAQRIDLLQRNPGRPLERSAIAASPQAPGASNVRVVGNQAPQAVPQGVERGMSGPPPATVPRSGGDVVRAVPPGTGSPAAVVPGPGSAGLQRERSGMPGTPGAPAAVAPPVVPPSAPAPSAPPGQINRGAGGVTSVPPATQPGMQPSPAPRANMPPQAFQPAPPPPPMTRDRGSAAPVPAPSVQPGFAPPRPGGAPEPVQRAAPVPVPSAPPQQVQRAAPPTPPVQRAPDVAPQPMPRAAPVPVPAPAPQVMPQPAPRPAPDPSQAPMSRQREMQPQPQAPQPRAAPVAPAPPQPQAAPQPRAAPVAPAPPQPSAAPAPAPPQGGDQQLQRGGRGGRGNDDDKGKN